MHDLAYNSTGERFYRQFLFWRERPQAAALNAHSWTDLPAPDGAGWRGSAPSNGALRLGTYRPIWAAPEVEVSPALHYTIARQHVELSPRDAERLRVTHGEMVTVSQNGTALKAPAHVRADVPAGTAFLAEGIAADSANVLTEQTIEVSKDP